MLRGKHKPSFTPNSDCGDNVIVINADNLRVTGKKMTDKIYITHSGYPGGQKRINLRDKKAKDSTRVIEHAVRGMLQGNKLGAEQFRNLYRVRWHRAPPRSSAAESCFFLASVSRIRLLFSLIPPLNGNLQYLW